MENWKKPKSKKIHLISFKFIQNISVKMTWKKSQVEKINCMRKITMPNNPLIVKMTMKTCSSYSSNFLTFTSGSSLPVYLPGFTFLRSLMLRLLHRTWRIRATAYTFLSHQPFSIICPQSQIHGPFEKLQLIIKVFQEEAKGKSGRK